MKLLLKLFILLIACIVYLGWIASAFSTSENLSPEKNTIKIKNKLDEFRKISLTNKRDIPLSIVEQYYDSIGPEVMLDIVEQDPLCHDVAHNIGIVIFSRTKDLSKAIEICQRRCNEACFHGILMGLFSQQVGNHTHTDDKAHSHVTSGEFEIKFPSLCKTAPLDSYPKSGCYHAIGHVATFVADYQVEKALHFCKLLSDKMPTYVCATGAYMEFIDGRDGKAQFNDSICGNSLDFPAACYRYEMINRWTKNADYRDLALYCLSLSDSSQRAGCFHGYGYGSLRYLHDNPKTLKHVCNFGSKIDKRMCIEGAAAKLGSYNQTKRKEACMTIGDQQLKKICLSTRNLDLNNDPDLYYGTRNKNLFRIVLEFMKTKLIA